MKAKTKKLLSVPPVLIFAGITLMGCSGATGTSTQSYLAGTWLCSSGENTADDANITFEDELFSYQYVTDPKNGKGTWQKDGETFTVEGKENENRDIFGNEKIDIPVNVEPGEEYQISLTGSDSVFSANREYISLKVEEDNFIISTANQVEGTDAFNADGVIQTKCVKQ